MPKVTTKDKRMIRAVLRRNGWTYQELADALYLKSKQSIYQMLSGRRGISESVRGHLVRLYDEARA